MFNKLKRADLLAVILLCFFAPLYFYNLGGYSLVDFDEAWYGEIAKNIIKTHNPFLLYFNGQPYLDHPPTGFILQAISMLIFGQNEIGVRMPSAIAGFLSPIVLYQIGKKLFNRTVGLTAALVLTSSVWFVYRARVGDLDTILLLLFLLSFYITVKVKDNLNYIYLLPILLVALLLTKSAIGAVIIPPIIIFLILQKVQIPKIKIINSVIIFFIILSPWFLQNYSKYQWGFVENIFKIGTRSNQKQSINFLEIYKAQTFTYLHYGIRKWYYPSLISFVGSFFFILKNKNLIPLYVWLVILFYGFLTNSKTEIWHLIPIYPPLALIIGFFLDKIVTIVVKNKKLASAIVILPVLALSIYQIYSFKGEIKLFDRQKDGVAETARAARGLSEKLFLDTDLYTPAVATFYSDKPVSILKLEQSPANTLQGIFQNGEKPFLLLTEKWKLDQDGVKPQNYQQLKEYQGHLLIKVI